MKKIISILILSILLINLIVAQTPPSAPSSANLTTPKIEIKDPTLKIDNALEKEIELSENTQIFARILFGIKGNIAVSTLILLLAIWAWVLFLLSEILPATPFFNSPTKAWLGAFAINIIISITSTYVTVAQFFINFGEDISFLKDWSAGWLVFSIIVIMVFFALFQKLLKRWKEKTALDEAREAGIRTGTTVAYAEAQAKASAEAAARLGK